MSKNQRSGQAPQFLEATPMSRNLKIFKSAKPKEQKKTSDLKSKSKNIDSNNPESLETRCDNCNVEFSQFVRPTRKFRVDPQQQGVSNFSGSPDPEPQQWFIGKALNEIFNWKFELLDLEKSNSKPFQNEESIRVCGDCGLIIAKLFSAIQNFQSIWVHESKISREVEDFVEQERSKSNRIVPVPEPPVFVERKRSKTIPKIPETTKNEPSESEDALIMIPGDSEHSGSRLVLPVSLPFDYKKLLSDDGAEADHIDGGEGPEFQEEFDVEAIVNPHRKRIRFGTQRQYLCQHCGAGFDKPYGLKRHIQLSHDEKERSHSCPHCSKSFHYSYSLNEHLKIHSSERNFICDLCGMAFKGQTSIQHHKMDVHKGDSFNCSFCSKSFRQFRSLAEHVEMIHKKKGTKDCPCSFNCGSYFKRKKSMLLHLRSSCKMNPESPKYDPKFQPVPETVWKCPLSCGGTYRYIASLKEHIRHRCPNRKHKRKVVPVAFRSSDPKFNPFLDPMESRNLKLPTENSDLENTSKTNFPDTSEQVIPCSQSPNTAENSSTTLLLPATNIDLNDMKFHTEPSASTSNDYLDMVLEVQNPNPLDSREIHTQIIYQDPDEPILQLVRDEFNELTVTVVDRPQIPETLFEQ